MPSGYFTGAVNAGFVSDKFLKRILTVLAVILGAELIWIFGVRPCMPVSRFEIRGFPGMDKSLVLTAAGIGEYSSFLTVNREAAETAIAALPMVRSARVIKHFPSGIEIILEKRNAAALALMETGGRVRPALIDGNGMIISVGGEDLRTGTAGQDIEKEFEDALPVISGLSLDKAFSGMKLSRVYGGLFRQLETIAAESPQLLMAVSEIRINQKNYAGFDLTIFPAHTPIRVRTGPELNAEILKYMLLALDVLSARAEEIEEIDFRTGTASYTLKEAYSG